MLLLLSFSSSSQALGQGFSLLVRQSQRAVAPPQKAKKKCGFNRLWSLPRTDVRPRGRVAESLQLRKDFLIQPFNLVKSRSVFGSETQTGVSMGYGVPLFIFFFHILMPSCPPQCEFPFLSPPFLGNFDLSGKNGKVAVSKNEIANPRCSAEVASTPAPHSGERG